MLRSRASIERVGLAIYLAALGLALPSASAQADHHLPATLEGGAPAQRFPDRAAPKPVRSAAARPAPSPSVAIDPHSILTRTALEARSLTLLEREIAVLRRLLDNTPARSERAADVLLRLSHAYQELMWIQKQELHALEQQRDCTCRKPQPREALAYLALR